MKSCAAGLTLHDEVYLRKCFEKLPDLGEVYEVFQK
jgi:hypothetical protein